MLTVISGINAARENVFLTLLLLVSITVLVSISQISIDATVLAITAAIELGALLSDRAQRITRVALPRQPENQ
jgi:hypothetical protein